MLAIREWLVTLSWQEHIGSTIVHVLDLAMNQAYTFVTPAKGGFMRLKRSDRIQVLCIANRTTEGNEAGAPERRFENCCKHSSRVSGQ